MKREYKKEDFRNLLVNVYDIPKGVDLVQELPVFSDHMEFRANLEKLSKYRNHILRYIVYVYDKGSPLRAIDDVNERKIEAAQLAGFTYSKKTNRFPTDIELIFRGCNFCVNEMIVRYCRTLGSTTYSMLVAATEDFYYNMKMAMTNTAVNDPNSVSATEKSKYLNNCESSKKRIDTYSAELLAQDNNKELNLDLFQVIDRETKRTLNLSPEARARVLAGKAKR